jgi:hypothetical protein
MLNVCLCGTCLFWPFVLLLHVTRIETIEIIHFYSFLFLITLICALGKKIKRIINKLFSLIKYLML